jgi:small subunit ribosomal protein S3
VGQKVHPYGFRIGVNRGWQSKWYADRNYTELVQEDIQVRRAIRGRYPEAGISTLEIDRNANMLTVTIHTAKPGIVIGRGGQKVDELKNLLEKQTGKRVRVNIQEIRQPELDAQLVARNVADQLQRRVSFRRALKQTAHHTMQRGAKGVKIVIGGRLGGAEMSRREKEHLGRVPLHTLRADIDYGLAEAHTTFGCIGVKVWIYRGDVLPEKAAETPEAMTRRETSREGRSAQREEAVSTSDAAT